VEIVREGDQEAPTLLDRAKEVVKKVGEKVAEKVVDHVADDSTTPSSPSYPDRIITSSARTSAQPNTINGETLVKNKCLCQQGEMR
jgi:hypothetical protein